MRRNMCGGTSEEHPADDDIQGHLEIVRDEIERKLGKLEELTALKYKSQIVNGTNYFVKARIGANAFIHVRLHKALSCNGGKTTLGGIRNAKTEQDPIEYFQ